MTITFLNYTIEPETDPWAIKSGMNYRFFPSDGIDCEQDGETFRSNVGYAQTVHDAIDQIWEMLDLHVVIMNGRRYTFDSFNDAVFFAVKWNGELLTPICNP